MSQARLWAFLGVALPVLAGLATQVSTLDLAYHLRIGQDLLSGAGIPTTDTMTFTTGGAAWQDQQWAAEILLAAVHRVGGWTGLIVLRAGLFGIIFGSVMIGVARAGVQVRDAALVSIGAFIVSIGALALRPQLLAMALFALTLLAIVERHRHPRLVWLVPLFAVAWGSVHGTFFLAPAAAGIAWLEDVAARHPGAGRMLAVTVAAAVAPAISPLGPTVYGYVLNISTNPLIAQRIEEWLPTTIRTVPGAVFFGSALAVAVLLAVRGSALRWPTLAWLAGLFVIGAYAIRGIAWWPIGAAVAIGPLLAPPEALAAAQAPEAATAQPPGAAPARSTVGTARANALVAILLVGLGLVLLPAWRAQDPLVGPMGLLREAPGDLTRGLQAIVRPGDRVFDPQQWGSWLEYAVPDARVFVDSRLELFPASVWQEYDAILAGSPGWREILDRYGVRIVAVPGDRPEMRDRLAGTGSWQQDFEGSEGWLFVRR